MLLLWGKRNNRTHSSKYGGREGKSSFDSQELVQEIKDENPGNCTNLLCISFF